MSQNSFFHVRYCMPQGTEPYYVTYFMCGDLPLFRHKASESPEESGLAVKCWVKWCLVCTEASESLAARSGVHPLVVDVSMRHCVVPQRFPAYSTRLFAP